MIQDKLLDNPDFIKNNKARLVDHTQLRFGVSSKKFLKNSLKNSKKTLKKFLKNS